MEGMKRIPVCDLLYHVALDTARPLLETSNGNKYILVAIDHYSKWCETRFVKEHDEEEIICRFGVPKYILIDNGSELMKEFDALC